MASEFNWNLDEEEKNDAKDEKNQSNSSGNNDNNDNKPPKKSGMVFFLVFSVLAFLGISILMNLTSSKYTEELTYTEFLRSDTV